MQELNRQMMALPELRELEEIIRFGTGPAAVSGVSGVHRAMLGAALRQETKRPLAVLCADEQEARRMAADLAALTGEECVTLFAREWQLRDRVSASHSFEQERLDALCCMAFGRTGIVVATVDGMLQRTLCLLYTSDAADGAARRGAHAPARGGARPACARRAPDRRGLCPLRAGRGRGAVRRARRHFRRLFSDERAGARRIFRYRDRRDGRV